MSQTRYLYYLKRELASLSTDVNRRGKKMNNAKFKAINMNSDLEHSLVTLHSDIATLLGQAPRSSTEADPYRRPSTLLKGKESLPEDVYDGLERLRSHVEHLSNGPTGTAHGARQRAAEEAINRLVETRPSDDLVKATKGLDGLTDDAAIKEGEEALMESILWWTRYHAGIEDQYIEVKTVTELMMVDWDIVRDARKELRDTFGKRQPNGVWGFGMIKDEAKARQCVVKMALYLDNILCEHANPQTGQCEKPSSEEEDPEKGEFDEAD